MLQDEGNRFYRELPELADRAKDLEVAALAVLQHAHLTAPEREALEESVRVARVIFLGFMRQKRSSPQEAES